MQPIRSGIPTTFRSANFRSRLEARWAAFFDLIGWRWTYEPVDASGYIPDFLIHGSHGFFVEVGPCIDSSDFVAKIDKPDRAAGELRRDVLIVGVSPLADLKISGSGSLAAGLLGEFSPGHVPGGPDCWSTPGFPCADHAPVLSWGVGVWGSLHKRLGIYHEFQSYTHRPNAETSEAPISDRWVDYIESLWNQAGSRVQWRAAS